MSEINPNPPEGVNPQVPPPAPDAAPLNYSTPATLGGVTQDEKTMGMLVHLLGILGFLGPLIIWLIKKDQSAFINDQGKEALNFHLTLLIALVIGLATMCIGIGLVIVPAVWVVGIVFSIIACLKAKDGIAYRYPFTIRFLK